MAEDVRHSMLPLGGFWAGACGASRDESLPLDDATLLRFCNLGYARGRCPRFPADSGPDAVRFTISSDNTVSLSLYYVMERDHAPFAHGSLEYSRLAGTLLSPEPRPQGNGFPSTDRFGRQAQAYIQSYLRRAGHGR